MIKGVAHWLAIVLLGIGLALGSTQPTDLSGKPGLIMPNDPGNGSGGGGGPI